MTIHLLEITEAVIGKSSPSIAPRLNRWKLMARCASDDPDTCVFLRQIVILGRSDSAGGLDMLSNQLAELWQESMQDEDFRFELKAQEVAVGLASAVSASGMTQKALADKLGWTTSRVSKVLHGATNLTLKTLFEVCEALNIEFDIAFDREGIRQKKVAVAKFNAAKP